MFIPTSANHPLGLHPGMNQKATVYNRTGAALVPGTIYKFDTAASAGEVDLDGTANSTTGTISAFGTANHPFSNVIATVSGDASATIDDLFFCLALTAIADNKKGDVLVRGMAPVLPAGAVTAWQPFSVSDGGDGDQGQAEVAAANERVVGFPTIAMVDGVLTNAYFDGISQAFNLLA